MPAFDTVINQYPMVPFVPYTEAEKAREKEVNIGPGLTLAAGTVMGQVSAAASDVQTLTIGGTPTGGTFPLTITSPLSGATSTITVPFNSTVAGTQALVNAAIGAGLLTVGGGTLPAATQTFTGAGAWANLPIPVLTGSITGLTGGTPTFAVAHTTVGSSLGTWKPYASGNADGTQTARGILKYPVATDAAGNVTFGTVAGGQWGQNYLTAPIYVCGIFRTLGMVGWDANARANLAAHLESGTDADGVVRIA